ncbi:MAG: hypothetical protein JWM68_2657, partial [Verrucomicrobiales bacterium]|nr:hypothetical protein [Verrucomicrobiales bacterium]
ELYSKVVLERMGSLSNCIRLLEKVLRRLPGLLNERHSIPMIPLRSLRHSLSCATLIALFLNLATAPTVSAQGTAFNYQGRLNDNGTPANGSFDLQFTIYNAVTNGTAISGTVTNAATGVSNGVFTTQLDFGANVFNGASRWLDIGVRTNGNPGAFTLLAPRQPLTSTPYAVQSLNSITAASAVSVSGSIAASQVSGILNASQIPNLDASKITGGTLTGNGAGLTNLQGVFAWQNSFGTNLQAASNKGYILTNNIAQVVVTLPAFPSFGDVVRVSGVGTGGWKIMPNTNQSVLGANFSSLIGVTWTEHVLSTSPFNDDPNDPTFNPTYVASSADGTKLVAALSYSELYTSGDSGVTWTRNMQVPQDVYWNAVASSADGTRLVALTDQVYTSANSGVTWTAQTGSPSGYCVASSADGAKLVMGTGTSIYTSTSAGATWTVRNTGVPNTSWASVASSSDGTKLVAAPSSGKLYTSANSGVSWTAHDAIRSWESVASSADGTRLVAVDKYGSDGNGGLIYTSVDSGATWIAQASGSRFWRSVASSADGTKLVAGPTISFSAFDRQWIYTSPNGGVTWIAQNTGLRAWSSVACSADGSKIVAGLDVANDNIYTSAAFQGTTPGTGYLVGSPLSAIELQYIGNGQFVTLSHEGNILAF